MIMKVHQVLNREARVLCSTLSLLHFGYAPVIGNPHPTLGIYFPSVICIYSECLQITQLPGENSGKN